MLSKGALLHKGWSLRGKEYSPEKHRLGLYALLEKNFQGVSLRRKSNFPQQ